MLAAQDFQSSCACACSATFITCLKDVLQYTLRFAKASICFIRLLTVAWQNRADILTLGVLTQRDTNNCLFNG